MGRSFVEGLTKGRTERRAGRAAARLTAALLAAGLLTAVPVGAAVAQPQSGTVARPLVPRPQPPAEPAPEPTTDPADPADPADPDAVFGDVEDPEEDRDFVRPDYEAPTTQRPQATVEQDWALLQALNKITARVDALGIPVGETAGFGTLAVTVRACRSTPPEQSPESAAFLQIDDTPPGEQTRRVFSGWMFASSPAIAAMDHPVYDVWVVECSDGPPPEPEDFGREKQYALPGTPPPPAPKRPPR